MANKILIPPGTEQLKIYSDASYTYILVGEPHAALTASVWRLFRVDADGSVTWPDGGNTDYDYAATDLATVQGYFA